MSPKTQGFDLISIARSWYDQGVIAIPCHWGSKHPAIHWRAIYTTRPTLQQVMESFSTRLYRNLAVLVGSVSRDLVILDYDMPLLYYQARDEYEPIASTYTVRTVRGFHTYFFVNNLPSRSFKLLGLDVKVNGYAIAPPSIHSTGLPYAVYMDASIQHIASLGDIGVNPPVYRLEAARSVLPEISLASKIKATLPIASFLDRYTDLLPSSTDGRWLKGNCVFHPDRNPSMWVDTDRQRCGCFTTGCRANDISMDVIDVFAHIAGLSNGDAMKELAFQLGV